MKKRHIRQTLIEENLFSMKEKVPVSARNLNIIEDYLNGLTYEAVGKKYLISKERVRSIIVNYIAACHQYLRNNITQE